MWIALKELFGSATLELGKWIFFRTQTKIAYKERLKDIIQRFADCVDPSKNCSLTYIIESGVNIVRWMLDVQKKGEKQKIDEDEAKRIESRYLLLLKRSRMLYDWFSFFQDRIDSIYLKDTLNVYREFSRIFTNTGDIFSDFLKDSDERVLEEVRKADAYLTFKRIYNDILNDLEKFAHEVSKSKKWGKFTPDSFPPLAEF